METPFWKAKSELGTSNLWIQFYDPIFRSRPPGGAGFVDSSRFSTTLRPPPTAGRPEGCRWYREVPRSDVSDFFWRLFPLAGPDKASVHSVWRSEQMCLFGRAPRELARTSRQPRARGWAQPKYIYILSHRADFFEAGISHQQIMET